MWYPPDPDEPVSELYRLMPPRRKPSELQEALDAANGAGGRDDGGGLVVPRWRVLAARGVPVSRSAARWVWGLVTASLAVVIGSLMYGWLSSH